jgi:hypothetical protein
MIGANTMKKAEIIASLEKKIKHNAYRARIHDEIQGLGYDVNMMKYERDTHSGKAFACMEILADIRGKAVDDLWNAAVEEATQDIIKTNYNIVKLLDLAGYDGEAHYEVHTKYNQFPA